jgi:putative pyruvate formate lyase activating enzyme
MPLGVADSRQVVRWFAREMPQDAYLSLMSQYTPFGDIEGFPELSRPIKAREYDAVLAEAISLGLSDRLFAQELSSSGEKYIPDWDY